MAGLGSIFGTLQKRADNIEGFMPKKKASTKPTAEQLSKAQAVSDKRAAVKKAKEAADAKQVADVNALRTQLESKLVYKNGVRVSSK